MKTLTLTAALILTAMSVPANANLWTAWKNGQLEPKDPDAAYRVETQGFDIRVYEWTPVTEPNKTCIAMFSETGSTLQCVEKGER